MGKAEETRPTHRLNSAGVILCWPIVLSIILSASLVILCSLDLSL